MSNETVRRNIEINVTGHVGDAESKIRSLEAKLQKLQRTASRTPSSFMESKQSSLGRFDRRNEAMAMKVRKAEGKVLKSKYRYAGDLSNELNKERRDVLKSNVQKIFNEPISKRLADRKMAKLEATKASLAAKGMTGLRAQSTAKWKRTNSDAIANDLYRRYEAKKAEPAKMAASQAKTREKLLRQSIRKTTASRLKDAFDSNIMERRMFQSAPAAQRTPTSRGSFRSRMYDRYNNTKQTFQNNVGRLRDRMSGNNRVNIGDQTSLPREGGRGVAIKKRGMGDTTGIFAKMKGAARTMMLFLGSIMMIIASVSRLTQALIAFGEKMTDVSDDMIKTKFYKGRLGKEETEAFDRAVARQTQLTGQTKGQVSSDLVVALSTMGRSGVKMKAKDIENLQMASYLYAETSATKPNGERMSASEAMKKMSGLALGRVKPQQAEMQSYKHTKNISQNIDNIVKILKQGELADLALSRISPTANIERMKNAPRALLESIVDGSHKMVEEYLKNAADYVQALFGQREGSSLPFIGKVATQSLGDISAKLVKFDSTGDDTMGLAAESLMRILDIFANIWIVIKPVVNMLLEYLNKFLSIFQEATAWIVEKVKSEEVQAFFSKMKEAIPQFASTINKKIQDWVNSFLAGIVNFVTGALAYLKMIFKPDKDQKERWADYHKGAMSLNYVYEGVDAGPKMTKEDMAKKFDSVPGGAAGVLLPPLLVGNAMLGNNHGGIGKGFNENYLAYPNEFSGKDSASKYADALDKQPYMPTGKGTVVNATNAYITTDANGGSNVKFNEQ